jgi:DNA-binding NarL/FixJ family response regulator
MEPNTCLSVLEPLPHLSRRQAPGDLTRREREVAFLVAEGLKNHAIARRLALSPATVATYVQRIQARLGLHHRNEIADWVHLQATSLHPDVLPPASDDTAQRELRRTPVIGLVTEV